MVKAKINPPEQKGLGFFPGVEDDRDFLLESFLDEEKVQAEGLTTGSRYYGNPERLDQGKEGACVGFGFSQMYNSYPKPHHLTNQIAHDIYCEATYNDPWPDQNCTNSSGTSVRAGAYVMQKRGLISNYAFVYDIATMALWILNKSPVVIGVDWLTGMDNPNYQNGYFIKATGSVRGGHCTELDGVNWTGRLEGSKFRILNSWGNKWGKDGRAWITATDLASLFTRRGATGCTAVEV